MKYRQLLNELLTLSDEQLELETLVFIRDKDNFVRPNNGLVYVTEFDEFDEDLVTNYPFIRV
tara:strand:- start:246 stop:431 length:186 start_codon:yes stop_codon:yes gene_type:complete